MHLSLWEKESFYAPADVLIAGGGFTGLWCAYFLKKKHPKLSIALVERGTIPFGASTRNAGFACFGSPTELLSDQQTLGEDKMLEIADMRYQGLLSIRKLFSKKQIGFDPCGGYELLKALTPERYDLFRDNLETLNRKLSDVTGRKKTFYFDDKQISRFGFRGIAHLIKTDEEGSLHPGKLCLALSQTVQAMGVRILNGIEIKHFQEHANGVQFFTDKDIMLQSSKLIVCTNAFARQLLPSLDIIPARGQVLVTAPIPKLSIRGTFHFDEGYYYFRNLGDRLLIGGARNAHREQETTLDTEVTDNIQRKLEDFISQHLLPGVQPEITDRWSGIMGMGPEKTPLIQRVSSHIFAAVRMNGMGVALAPTAARKIAAMVTDTD